MAPPLLPWVTQLALGPITSADAQGQMLGFVHTAPAKYSEIFEIMTDNVFTDEVGQPLEVGHVVTTNPIQIEVPRALISTHSQLKKQRIKGFRKTSV